MGVSLTSLTTILGYYEGRYNMFVILIPTRIYYFDNIVTPSAFIHRPNFSVAKIVKYRKNTTGRNVQVPRNKVH